MPTKSFIDDGSEAEFSHGDDVDEHNNHHDHTGQLIVAEMANLPDAHMLALTTCNHTVLDDCIVCHGVDNTGKSPARK